MNRHAFWQLIASTAADAGNEPKLQLDLLRRALAQLELDDILDFDRCFSRYHRVAYTAPLWAAAQVIGAGCSDDGFADFRGWLISRGYAIYKTALANPDTLAECMSEHDHNGQIEGFEYLAAEAWAARTGQSEEDFPHIAAPVPREPSGVALPSSTWPVRYPRLWARYGRPDTQKAAAADSAPLPHAVLIETLGTVTVGDLLHHATFGPGVVEAITSTASVVVLRMRFGTSSKSIAVLKGCAYLRKV